MNNATRKKLDEVKKTIISYLSVAPTNDSLRKQLSSRLFDKGELSNNMILRSRISPSNIEKMKNTIRRRTGLLTENALKPLTNLNRTNVTRYIHVTDGGNHKYRTCRRRTRRRRTHRR
jgi:hypothetical protein